MTPENEKLIAEVRRLDKAATPGPWFAWNTMAAGATVQIGKGWLFARSQYGTDVDAEVIAKFRTAVPAIADALEAADATIERLTREHEQVLAALRAAKLVQGTYHDGCPLEELFSTIDGLAAALSAQLVAAMLANRNAGASDAGTGQDTPTG